LFRPLSILSFNPMKSPWQSVKVIIILLLVLSFVFFYESKRIEAFAINMENGVLRSLALSLTYASQNLKSDLGLNPYFEAEERFWQRIKNSPKIFNAQAPVQINNEVPLVNENIEILPPYNFLLIGDSFMAEAFGPALEKELILYKNVLVFRKGVYSTGLSRPDYFDWEKEVKDLILQKKPNLAVVMFGANDGQDIRTQNIIIRYGQEEWNINYGQKVSAFLKILNDNNIFVFWIGNPIARSSYYSSKMANLNSIYEAECQKSVNCRYVSTWSLLTDSQGKYSAYLPDQNNKNRLARANDGIHTTSFGSQILVKEVIRKIKEKIGLEKL